MSSPSVPGIVAVVPAAGRSSRFGSMKLLALVDGRPLLDRTIASLLRAGISRVIVVVAEHVNLELVEALGDSRVLVVVNPDPDRGMFSSIQTGLAHARSATADPARILMVLPADMPFVRSDTVAALGVECGRLGRPVVPMHDGRHGHPIALPGEIAGSLSAASPAVSLKDALRMIDAEPVGLRVDDPGVLRDVDVPADLT